MFSNIIATSEYAWAPSFGVLPDDNVGVDGNQHANIEQPDLKEGSNDSEEDEIPNLIDDVCNMVRGINISSSSNTHSSSKRKEKKENVLRLKLGKKKELWNWVTTTITVGSNG
jgi:hypothetical protein